jgi:tetratricopeptide (TPR) repeat protein
MEQRARLESWKEISSYLKRSMSTCHRWEEELGLPVHRLDGTPKARVFAYPEELDRWLGEKLHLAEAMIKEEGRARHNKGRWALVSAGALAVIAGLVFAAWRFLLPAPAPYNNPWMAVLPFENATGDDSLEPWTTAFSDLLTTDLRQSRFINVLGLTEIDSTLGLLKFAEPRKFTLADIAKIVSELDVDYAVTGTLVRAGEDIIVKVLVYDARARLVSSAIRSGVREESLLAMTDKLSREVKVAAKLAPRAVSHDLDRPVAEVSTASPEAFKLYSRGYRLGGRGELEESFSFLQKAVDIDPEFGLAYKALYGASRNAGRREDQAKYAETAIRNSHRLSERELLLLEAEYYGVFQGNKVKALTVNEDLWTLFPDYPEAPGGRLFLPDLYWLTEEYDKLIAAFERIGTRRRRKSGNPFLLVSCYEAKGLFDRAEKFIGDFSGLNPGLQDMNSRLRCNLLIAQRRFSEALALLTTGSGQGSRPRTRVESDRLGYFFWASDDLANAQREYEGDVSPGDYEEDDVRLANLSVVALSGGRIGRLEELARRGIEIARNEKDAGMESRWRYILALALRLCGRLPEALAEAAEACRKYEERGQSGLHALQLRTLITLELGRTAEFDEQVEGIKRVVERGPNQKLMRAYYHLLGQRELRKGNFEGARSHFWKALDLLPGVRQGLDDGDPVRYYFALAEAYDRLGNGNAAIPFYEKVVSTTRGRSWSGDLYALSFYRMGKIHESMLEGRTPSSQTAEFRTKAIEDYRKFLALWKAADPIFPEIEDAKKCLAGLETGGQVPADRSN